MRLCAMNITPDYWVTERDNLEFYWEIPGYLNIPKI